MLLLLLNALLLWSLTRPPEVHYNWHQAMAAELVGGEAPTLEARWALLSASKPTASAMPWDPPPASPQPPLVCGAGQGFQAGFGTSGDSLLLYFEGH